MRAKAGPSGPPHPPWGRSAGRAHRHPSAPVVARAGPSTLAGARRPPGRSAPPGEGAGHAARPAATVRCAHGRRERRGLVLGLARCRARRSLSGLHTPDRDPRARRQQVGLLSLGRSERGRRPVHPDEVGVAVPVSAGWLAGTWGSRVARQARSSPRTNPAARPVSRWTATGLVDAHLARPSTLAPHSRVLGAVPACAPVTDGRPRDALRDRPPDRKVRRATDG
jgi:hypothetical protein